MNRRSSAEQHIAPADVGDPLGPHSLPSRPGGQGSNRITATISDEVLGIGQGSDGETATRAQHRGDAHCDRLTRRLHLRERHPGDLALHVPSDTRVPDFQHCFEVSRALDIEQPWTGDGFGHVAISGGIDDLDLSPVARRRRV